MIQLHTILQHEDIEQLASDEISYLQLHFMEKLEIEEIATLLEREYTELKHIAARFSYHPSAKSTI
jgi:hypothetical protein